MKKIVLLSNKKYSAESDDFLLSLINQGCELICFVGLDCESWEEAMDELAIGDGSDPKYITTTSHPAESLDEVINMAKHMKTGGFNNINVVEV